MSEHDHHDHHHAEHADPPALETRDAGSQALAEALHSSFAIVKVAMVLLVVVILGAGFFRVNPGEKAVILRFGKPVGEGQKMLLSSGKFYWSFPYPIDEVVRIPISEIQKVTSTAGWYYMTREEEVTYETMGTEPAGNGINLDPRKDSYVISADRNIIHTRATVYYRIEDPLAAIFHFTAGTNQQFNTGGISNAVQNAANNALVATAARFNVDDILTLDIAGFQDAVRHRLNDLVEREHLGVAVDQCQVQSEAPRQLADTFRLVTAARQSRDKSIQVAQGDQNRILSEAGAQAVGITNSAEAARNRYVTSVQSEAEAFTRLLPQYESNPLLYEELALTKTMPEIFTNVEKIYLPQRADGRTRELRLMLNREPPQNSRAAGGP